MASILSVLKDGTMTEVGTVGSEGMVGLPVFFGAKTSARRVCWQFQGSAHRMDAELLRRETRKGGALSDALHLYTQALFAQVSQLATCNRLHTIEQRCCCWLLTTHDRVKGDELDLTHEFLSEMLGTRRAGVTEVAGTLQRAGLIEYRHGHVTVRNRRGLEKAACECYRVVRDEFDRLLG
ncbi:MAG: helix-turn-helix domain-containing protein [Verrucomicrobiota bacterium]